MSKCNAKDFVLGEMRGTCVGDEQASSKLLDLNSNIVSNNVVIGCKNCVLVIVLTYS